MKRTATTKRGGSRFKFFTETIAELRKAVWPTRQEAIRLTIIVLVICLVMGGILGVLDYGFTRLMKEVFLGGG
ncbi:MAG: preprotein translocase subunit SecE [Dehalococcoidia bacterium]|nr:MAG: preprotein translocase subunit SecE [Dehalococcoidia bacterium]